MEAILETRDLAHHEAACPATAGEFLTFRLGTEEYGVDILRVQEIRSYEPPTRLAHAAACVSGVTDLRGSVVPILDLRVLLGCASDRFDGVTAIIVFNLGRQVVGAVVDSVCDVLRLGHAELKPPPRLRTRFAREYIVGIGCSGAGAAERLLVLVDIDALVAGAGAFAARTAHDRLSVRGAGL